MSARRRTRAPETPDNLLSLYDDIRDPAERFESEATARVALQAVTRLTADVVIDLERKGALHHYVLEHRQDAIEALMALVDVDPNDAKTIYALQRRIHPYFDACQFIKRTIEAGREADEVIEEMYRHGDTPGD